MNMDVEKFLDEYDLLHHGAITEVVDLQEPGLMYAAWLKKRKELADKLLLAVAEGQWFTP